MKTINNTNENKEAMKTNNNVQKAILRGAAVFTSFILISYAVAAQDFWKQLLTNNSFNEFATALATNSGENIVSGENAIYTEMVNSNFANFTIEEEIENPLQIKNWMIESPFEAESEFSYMKDEIENPLQIEDWMVSDQIFEITEEDEEPLKMEPWMLVLNK